MVDVIGVQETLLRLDFNACTLPTTGTYRDNMDYFGDRSWMYLRKERGQLGLRPEFYAGVEAFLDYAYSHPIHVVDGKIICPCKGCKLDKYED